jgi:hypothetical protein
MPLDHDTALDEIDTDEDRLGEVHRRAMRRFDDVAWDQQELRTKSLEARRFVSIPGAQWDGEWGEQFENAIKIESDKLRRAVRKVETDYRENRIVPDFRPDGPDADKETADTLDGMHRADSYRFKSQQARDNAVFEAVTGGFGAYRVTNEWEDESNPENDHQRINPASVIVDADQSVFFDTNSRLYDKSDARFAFIRVALSRDAFEEMYPDASAVEWPEGTTWRMRDWFQPDTVAVAEYYEIEEVTETLHVLTHSISGEQKRVFASDLMEGELARFSRDGYVDKRQRRKRRRVHKYIMSGAEVLEDRGYIAGDQIPIIPVYGKRYFVEGMERWEGIVQPRMDDQRLHNTSVSKLAEMNSLSPREVPIFAPEQITGLLPDIWARANIDRSPYLLAEPLRNEDGSIAAQGPLAYLKPPDLPPALAAIIQYTGQSLAEDAQDGADEIRANTSAEAMELAATRVDAKSGIYLDNIAQSVKREGEVYFGMSREVYSEKGRKVELMTEDGDDGVAVLKKMVTDKDTAKQRVVNDFQGARYKVIVSVTEATATRRDKTVRAMMNVATAAGTIGDTELAQAALLTAVMNTDGEGSDDFIAWARQRALSIGLVQPTEDEIAAAQAASENQEPDPTQQLVEAETAARLADVKKTEAETIETLADAENTAADTEKTRAETAETMVKTILMRGQNAA